MSDTISLFQNDLNISLSATEITHESLPEFAGQIADLFEDFLDDNHIILINNPDRIENVKDENDLSNTAQIYGEYYGLLTDPVRSVLGDSLEKDQKISLSSLNALPYQILDCFKEIMSEGKASRKLSDEDESSLLHKVYDTFKSWGLELHQSETISSHPVSEIKYYPESKEELQRLCDDLTVNLGEIDTSKITDMSQTFYESNRTDFSGIEKWDVSNVTNMQYMFSQVNLSGIDLSLWNVSKVKKMEGMFRDSVIDTNFASWDVSSVKDMDSMFQDCTFVSNPHVENWDNASLLTFVAMFKGSNCNFDLSKWNVPKNSDFYEAFYNTPMTYDQMPPVVKKTYIFEDQQNTGEILKESFDAPIDSEKQSKTVKHSLH